mmetsp:Transcript_87497/g.155191  ORF Transcript_87497/g.155191 Transcript_87497/m.155191 type:complete len:105 (-) Transcript_87497:2-316(-)
MTEKELALDICKTRCWDSSNPHQQSVDMVRATFFQADVDGDGWLNEQELEAAMEDIGSKKSDAPKLMAAASSTQDGYMDVYDFIRWSYSGKAAASRALKAMQRS